MNKETSVFQDTRLNVCYWNAYNSTKTNIFHKEWNSDSPQIHAKQQKHHQRQGIKKTKNKKQNNKTKHYDNRITKTQKQD